MTVHQLGKELLRDLGVVTLVPVGDADASNQRGPSEGDLQAVINAINSANLEIASGCPETVFQRTFGFLLPQPTQITIAVTSGSRDCTITGWESWMEGCSILINRESPIYELVSETELSRPWIGATGSVEATVYADCVALTEDNHTGATGIDTVISVNMPGYGEMREAGSRLDYDTACGWARVTSPHFRPMGTPTIVFNKTTGTPNLYFVDTRNNGTLVKYLRFNPMPATDYTIEVRAKAEPPTYTERDIDNGDHNTDPGVEIVTPSTLLTLKAVARQWLSGDIRFANSAAKPEIQRAYKTAIDSLADLRPGGIAAEAIIHNPPFRK